MLENEELPCEILDHLLKFKLSRLLVWTIRTIDRKQVNKQHTEHNSLQITNIRLLINPSIWAYSQINLSLRLTCDGRHTSIYSVDH